MGIVSPIQAPADPAPEAAIPPAAALAVLAGEPAGAALAAAYRRRTRQTAVEGARSAEALVRALLDAAAAAAGWSEAAALAEARSIAGRRQATTLALAAAALVLVEAGCFEEARLAAERAVGADQHDLFAQRLMLAAAERSADLSLAVDDWLRDRYCASPFTEVEVRADGAINTCCSAWLPSAIGSIEDPSPAAWWNGAAAREIRRSVLQGDFSHCSRLYCPKIVRRSLPRRDGPPTSLDRAMVAMELVAVDHRPRRVILSEDRSCNLSCPSCRTGLIVMGQAETRRLDALFDARILPMLDEAVAIKVTGSGDPFASRHFRHVLKRLSALPPRRRIQLQTNGLLFDEAAWTELGLAGHVSSVWVSVDAAQPETYAVVRRGGDFHRLLANLAFLGGLRREGAIDRLRLDFVVQAANVGEIPAFAILAREIGADGVHFLRLRNWGTVAPEAFGALDVCSPAHPDHGRLLAALADPALAWAGVDLGNVAGLAGGLDEDETP
jgi:hypothetical protein